MAARDERHDVQAIIRSGFGSLGGARYLLLRIEQAAAARSWLASLPVTPASAAGGDDLAHVLQVALTAAGLRVLGYSEDAMARFAPEFVEGLAGDARRSHRLGDTGANAPVHWDWGTGESEPHVLILLMAHRDGIAGWAATIEIQALSSGLSLVRHFESCPAREDGGPGREPFGFADGISQPELDWDSQVQVTGAANRDYRNAIAPGEVLLGHSNEYGFVADYPEHGSTGRNGTYLVYRQLAQDVTGFWTWVARIAGPQNAVAVAEQMVGRRMDGSPLDGLQADGGDFLYRADPEGRVCPLGAHIRRANPRIGDDPLGKRGFLLDLISSVGLAGTAQDDAVASSRFHRLVRRGRPYGQLVDWREALAADGPTIESGLHFICLNASLARQFEFVQGAWLASATFGGLAGEQDPLIGTREPFPHGHATDAFSLCNDAGDPLLVAGLARFVTVRGGAYFFLPGLAGLASILKP